MSTSSPTHTNRVSALIAGLLGLLISGTSFASGGIGGGGMSGSAGSPSTARKHKVDESYEYGKAVYLGRSSDAKKLAWCVLVDGEAKKVKKKTLKPYRRKTQSELANALYLCNEPSTLALTALKREQIAFVLYYLNKRFKLKLSDV